MFSDHKHGHLSQLSLLLAQLMRQSLIDVFVLLRPKLVYVLIGDDSIIHHYICGILSSLENILSNDSPVFSCMKSDGRENDNNNNKSINNVCELI